MEDIVPPQTESGAGFEPVRVRQFTVLLENRVGRLQTLIRAYEGMAGQIVSLSIVNASDTALVRLIYTDADRAREILQNNGFAFTEQDLLVVQLPKRTHQPLISICSALLAAEIGINYAYPLLHTPHGPALALCIDDLTLAAQILLRKGFTLIGESDLHKLDET